MFRKITNIFLFTFLCSVVTFGQDLTKDIEQIVKNLDSASSVSIKVKVDVYNRKGGTKSYSTSASMQRQKNSSLNILAEQENFDSPTFQVSVDHEEKTILILKKDPKKAAQLKKEALDIDIKKLQKILAKENDENTKDTKVVKLISNTSGIKKYSITKVAGYKEIILVLDMNQNTFKTISYEYSEKSEMKGQYISLEYTEFKMGLDLSNQLSTSKYFTESNGKYVLVASLKTYKLFTEL